jgi:CubicO group peptidase (beta-lactamase class C family)
MDAMTDSNPGATLANWRDAPYSRWAFHHAQQVVRTDPIPAAGATASALPIALRDLGGFRLGHGEGAMDLAAFLEATSSDAFVVLLDGKIVHETYAPGMTGRTPHILMSASKSLTGLIAGILSEAGELDLEAPVSDLVPEVTDTAYRGATLRQLLDMRTGVALNLHDAAAYEASTGWEPPPASGPGDLHAFYPAMTTPWAPHGGPFRYVSANTDLLGWAMERATRQSFAGLVSDLLWKPMGAADDGYITLDPRGAPRATGGLGATPHDLARLGQLMVQDGRRDGVQVIPKGWIDDIAQCGDAEAWRTGEFAAGFQGLTMRYRGGWYVIDGAPQTLFAMGIHGQNLFVDRTNGLVIVKVSSQPQRLDFRAIGLTHRAVPEIRRCLGL